MKRDCAHHGLRGKQKNLVLLVPDELHVSYDSFIHNSFFDTWIL